MNRMRQRIAQRLKDSQNTCASLTTFNELDMSGILSMRKEYKVDYLNQNSLFTLIQDLFEKTHDQKLGFMSAFIKAAANGLQDEPAINAVIDDVTNEIIYRKTFDTIHIDGNILCPIDIIIIRLIGTSWTSLSLLPLQKVLLFQLSEMLSLYLSWR